QPGESLKLSGRWVQDKKYGEQFQVESWLTMQPSTVLGMERYLGSGLVRGVGRVMAKRLVARFGLDTLDVIDRDPARLTEVEGIGAQRSRAIQKAWQQQRQIHQVMVFLQGHGVAAHHAVKIYKTYGDEAMRVVSETPYRLASEVWGIGFQTADSIASRLGLPADAPARLAAGLLHALSRAADEGHLFLPRAELLAAAKELLGTDETLLPPALAALETEEKVVIERDAVYLIPFFLAERSAALRLRRLLSFPLPPVGVDVERACRWFEERFRVALAPAQHEAIRRAVLGKVLVLTGGPGTGKTTLVRALVEIFGKKGERVLLAAPTGRAAKRMAETTGHDASTLHRLLEWSPQSGRFERNEERPLAADLLVVDEVSMLDMLLAHHLLKAVPEQARLVLVGDADQLPSVGPGNVLAEMLASGVVPSVRLTRIFRQDGAGLIVGNAHRVLGGEMPIDAPDGIASDFFSIEREDPDEALDTLRRLIAERIPARFGFDPKSDVQVLSPMRRGRLGTISLNAELQALLNPSGAPVEGSRGRLRIGDRVLQTKNDYQLDVFNGDLGRVEAVDEEAAEVVVRFDERIVRYPAGELDALELAYACSVHKSQGSEYPCVVVVVHREHYVLLQRNLLYTAMTRGKKLVVLLGSRSAVRRAVKNADPQKRYTRLAERLRA
ncbi:MAG TPA: ATP-dependent RecD-like DNA helicase, partial [Thermoanaerobaculia bacterium]|nr:ATP-dependent RecD-like DNA helicase [Thermoanaerobaculia bacterium]